MLVVWPYFIVLCVVSCVARFGKKFLQQLHHWVFCLCLTVHPCDHSVSGVNTELADTHPSASHDHSQFCRALSCDHTYQHHHPLCHASHCASLKWAHAPTHPQTHWNACDACSRLCWLDWMESREFLVLVYKKRSLIGQWFLNIPLMYNLVSVRRSGGWYV